MNIMVKKNELVGAARDIPLAVARLMCIRQYDRQGYIDFQIFCNELSADDCSGGFDWDESPEGYQWWSDIINDRDYSNMVGPLCADIAVYPLLPNTIRL